MPRQEQLADRGHRGRGCRGGIALTAAAQARSGGVHPTNSNGRVAIFKERRARFMAEMGAAVAILPGAPVAVRSNDVEFAYRQDSDFYYLTGFAEPESVALFAPGHKDGEFVMFVRPRD